MSQNDEVVYFKCVNYMERQLCVNKAVMKKQLEKDAVSYGGRRASAQGNGCRWVRTAVRRAVFHVVWFSGEMVACPGDKPSLDAQMTEAVRLLPGFLTPSSLVESAA